jgi:hypothetical protein
MIVQDKNFENWEITVRKSADAGSKSEFLIPSWNQDGHAGRRIRDGCDRRETEDPKVQEVIAEHEKKTPQNA